MIQAICDRHFDVLVDSQLAIDLWAQCSAHLRASGLASSSKEAAQVSYEQLDEMVRSDILQAFLQSLLSAPMTDEGLAPGSRLYARTRNRLRTLGAELKPAKTPPIDRSRALGL